MKTNYSDIIKIVYNERQYLVKIGNILLAVVYVFGALITLFPTQQTIIPHEFGYLSIGVLLLSTSLFGSPYYKFVE